MLEYISAMVTSFPEIQDGADHCGMTPQELVRKAVRRFVREYVPGSATPDELLQTPHGTLSHEDARALYKQLSSYFARKANEQIPSAIRKKRGAAGAAKRWGKTT